MLWIIHWSTVVHTLGIFEVSVGISFSIISLVVILVSLKMRILWSLVVISLIRILIVGSVMVIVSLDLVFGQFISVVGIINYVLDF